MFDSIQGSEDKQEIMKGQMAAQIVLKPHGEKIISPGSASSQTPDTHIVPDPHIKYSVSPFGIS